jgi:hypothetical protein
MAWFNPNWKYREKITVSSSKVPGTLSDFAVYIDLSDMSSNFFPNVKSDGGDIRITQSNGTTEQAVQIVFITVGSSIGELHFKASTLSALSDTIFYLYYGNSGASLPAAGDTYGSQNVWDSYHKLVWHCQEDPSGGSNAVKDSTSNANHGTGGSTMTSGDLVAGQLSGNGYDFDGGTNDVVDSANDLFSNANFNTGATTSFWINGVTSSLSQPFDIEGWYAGQSTSNKYRASTDGGGSIRTQPSAPSAGWHFITIEHTSNGGTSKLYIDNESVVSGSTGTTNVDSTNRPFRLGGWAGGSSFRFTGQLDESRISIGIVRGQNWHDTIYNNQGDPSTFYTVSPVEVGFTPQVMIWQ